MVEHGTVWYNTVEYVTVWYQEFITVMNSWWYIKVSVHGTLWYGSGKLSREKIFAIREKYGDMASFGGIISGTSNLQKFSARKFYFPPICKSFLPRKFPAIRYSGMVWYKLWYGDVYTEHHCTLVANFYGMQYLQLCQNFDIGLAVWELREGEMKAIRDLKMKREKEIEKGEGRERGRETDREVPGRGLVLVS